MGIMTATTITVDLGGNLRRAATHQKELVMRSRRLVRSVAGAAALTVALTAAGCADTAPDAAPVTTEVLQPKSGGPLVVAIPAQPNGFDPSRAAFSPSALQIMKAVVDPLAALDANGEVKPYLAESFTPNADFTQWTIQLRDGVTFHDGAVLDAAAVKANLDDRIGGLVTSGTLLDVTEGGVEVTGPLTVSVKMKRPWAHFPLLLANQAGFMLSPNSFATPEALADIAVRPVGSGPFQWDQWKRDERVTVKRFADYWQTDSNGVQLPYLSTVTFEFTPDPASQVSNVVNGNANAFISTAPGTSATAKSAGLNVSEERTEGSELFAVLNSGAGFTFSDQSLRIAAASAIDRDDMNNVLYDGQLVPALGPTSSTSMWGEPTTYPSFDPDAARKLVSQAKADGKQTTIRLSVVANTENAAYAQYMADRWDAVGFTTTVEASPENVFGVKLVTAAADVSMFNYWADSDPDQLWHLMSEATAPDTGVGLNFARWKSAAAEDALTEGRASTDPAVRQAAYQRLWDEMGKDVPLLFLFHTPTTVGWDDNVHGMDTFVFPDGTPGVPFVWGNGTLTWTWVG